MNPIKTGELIRALRMELGMTQQQLAQRLHVGDKAVSKWERGAGCPDVSLLPSLAEALGVGLDSLMAGELDTNAHTGGNMKRTKFYVCPDCGKTHNIFGESHIEEIAKKHGIKHIFQIPINPEIAKAVDSGTIEDFENDYFKDAKTLL